MEGGIHYSLGEWGFEPIRYGGQMPTPDLCDLAHLIPLVMRIPDKSKIGLCEVSRVELGSILNVCAGMVVKTVASAELRASIRIDVSDRKIEISSDGVGGLRDAIFAGVLLRVFHEEPLLSGLGMEAVIDEAKLRIMDELPQVLTYSGSPTLHLSLLDDGRVVMQTDHNPCVRPLPFELEEHVVQRSEILISAA